MVVYAPSHDPPPEYTRDFSVSADESCKTRSTAPEASGISNTESPLSSKKDADVLDQFTPPSLERQTSSEELPPMYMNKSPSVALQMDGPLSFVDQIPKSPVTFRSVPIESSAVSYVFMYAPSKPTLAYTT